MRHTNRAVRARNEGEMASRAAFLTHVVCVSTSGWVVWGEVLNTARWLSPEQWREALRQEQLMASAVL